MQDDQKRHGPAALERNEAANQEHRGPQSITVGAVPIHGCARAVIGGARFYVWEQGPGHWLALRKSAAPSTVATCIAAPVRRSRLAGALEALGLRDPESAEWMPARRATAERLYRLLLSARRAA